jgi:hypothetical protein
LLLSLLKGNRRYQLRLCALLLGYWLLSGLNETLFQLTVARNISTTLFVIEQSMQIVVLLISIYLCFYFPRTLINSVSVAVMLLGSVIMTIGAYLDDKTLFLSGDILISILHYSISQNLLMLILESFPKPRFNLIWFISMTAFTLGKLLALWIHSAQPTNTQWAVCVVLPCAATYTLTLLLVRESPRYWIDHHLSKAEELLRDIAQINRVAY